MGKHNPIALYRCADAKGEQHDRELRQGPTSVESRNGGKAAPLVRSRKGAKAAKRYKKLIKLQREIDVVDDAIADEQLLSPSLREQVAKERAGEVTSLETAAESMERVRARLTELGELLTEAGNATVSKPGAR